MRSFYILKDVSNLIQQLNLSYLRKNGYMFCHEVSWNTVKIFNNYTLKMYKCVV